MTGKPWSMHSEDPSPPLSPEQASRLSELRSVLPSSSSQEFAAVTETTELDGGARAFLVQVSNVSFHINQCESEVEGLYEQIKVLEDRLVTLRRIERGLRA